MEQEGWGTMEEWRVEIGDGDGVMGDGPVTIGGVLEPIAFCVCTPYGIRFHSIYICY